MPARMWSVPPAEPPAHDTLPGSALNAATRSCHRLVAATCAGTTTTWNSPVRRAIGVRSVSLHRRLVGDDRADHHHAADHQRVALALHWLTNCGRPTAPPAPGACSNLNCLDDAVGTQHLLDGAAGLVPAAAGRRRHEDLQAVQRLRDRALGPQPQRRCHTGAQAALQNVPACLHDRPSPGVSSQDLPRGYSAGATVSHIGISRRAWTCGSCE